MAGSSTSISPPTCSSFFCESKVFEEEKRAEMSAVAPPPPVITKQQLSRNITDCPIDGIIVYQDRAEVTRQLIFQPEITGEHEITFTGVTLNAVS
jgi:hypothetical protein